MSIHKRSLLHRQQGFTLIELMIVVAIIAILGAISVPMYMKYIESSEKKAAYSILSSLPVFMDSYRAENDMFCDQCNVDSATGYTYAVKTDDNGVVVAPTASEKSLTTLYPGFKPRPDGDTTPLAYHYFLNIVVTNCATGCEEAVTYSAIAQTQRGTAPGNIVLQYD